RSTAGAGRPDQRRRRSRSTGTAPSRTARARRSRSRSRLLLAYLQRRDERFLRHLDAADVLHLALALFLFLEQLALARDVAAVALREHVLALRFDRLARDDAAADRRLHGNVEHLPGDELPQLVRHLTPIELRLVLVNDRAER